MASIREITWIIGWILMGVGISVLLGKTSLIVKLIIGIVYIVLFLFFTKKFRQRNKNE